MFNIKDEFIEVGGNSFILIDPPTAKFQGFEINKINILKIKISNKSPISQRIQVLPS